MQMKSILPSNRKFGFLFTSIFFVLSINSFVVAGASLNVFSLLFLSLLFLVASITNSELLTPLNKAWFHLGEVLGKVVSPIVLGAIFFLLITPVGVIARLLGRDELKLKRPKATSYWRSPIGSNSDSKSFKNQF